MTFSCLRNVSTEDQVPRDPSGATTIPYRLAASSIRISVCSAPVRRATSSASAIVRSTAGCRPRSPVSPRGPPHLCEPETSRNLLPRSTNRTFSAIVQLLIDPTGAKRKRCPSAVSEEGDPLQVVDAYGQFKGLQGGGRETAPDGASILPSARASNEGCLRLSASTTVAALPTESATRGGKERYRPPSDRPDRREDPLIRRCNTKPRPLPAYLLQ